MRSQFTLPDEETIRAQLEGYHEASQDERLERYKYIWGEFGPPSDMLFGGGIQAFLALEELKLCYLEGFYLAVILLAQVFVESSIGAEYILAGDDSSAEAGLSRLIKRAVADHIIDSALASELHELRRVRNAYVHPHGGNGAGTLIGRMLESYRNGTKYASPFEMAKDDAELAIHILVDFLHGSRRFGGKLAALREP